jgi:hypothetical protein
VVYGGGFLAIGNDTSVPGVYCVDFAGRGLRGLCRVRAGLVLS